MSKLVELVNRLESKPIIEGVAGREPTAYGKNGYFVDAVTAWEIKTVLIEYAAKLAEANLSK